MAADPPRAVVVGAGLGGLAAALRLSAKGWRVTVCEQFERPGGKMNRWTADGFRFDTGPSLITMPWVFEELFAAAGERLDEHLELVRVDPLAEYVYDDGTRFAHTASLPAWLDTVRSLEGGCADGFLAFLALGARLLELSKPTFFARSPREPPDPSALRALRHLPLRHAWGSYHRTVEHFFRGAHLRQLFDRYMTYIGSSPYRTPATLAVIPAVEYLYGVHHVRGGLYRLVETLCALLEHRGVEVRTDAQAARIETGGGRVQAVELADGARLPADAVVFNGDASRTPALLGRPDARPLPEGERSLSGLVLLYAVNRTLPDQPHHRVFFSADYPDEFRALFDERRFPSDPTVYVNMPSRTDRSLVPGEGETVFIMANAPANDGDAWDEAMLKEAEDRVFRRLLKGGFPDIRPWAAASAARTPRWMADHYGMPGGAIYGTHSHGRRHAFLRPPNRDPRVRGLYYAGGSTHPGGGTPTVLMSARIAVNLVERHER